MASIVAIDFDLCENEQVCLEVCPEDVFRVEKGLIQIAQAGACTLCFKCAESCPSGAIELDF